MFPQAEWFSPNPTIFGQKYIWVDIELEIRKLLEV